MATPNQTNAHAALIEYRRRASTYGRRAVPIAYAVVIRPTPRRTAESLAQQWAYQLRPRQDSNLRLPV